MSYPFSFYVAAAILCGLIGELWRFRLRPWAFPALVIYVTVGTWYFADPIAYPDRYRGMPELILSNSYWQVCLFLLVFRPLAPWLTARTARNTFASLPSTTLSVPRLFVCSVIFWAVLLVYGVSRMDWNLLAALFPMDARSGNLLWLRAAAGDAGPTGFLVSSCGYLYLMTSGAFGVMAVWLRQAVYKMAATFMILLSWPFFLMSGTRNQFLAVALPWVFTYLLFGRQHKMFRVATLLLAFLALNLAFKEVISHRNVGFHDLLLSKEQRDEDAVSLAETEHAGLNMIEELCFINIYCYGKDNHLTWGMDYLSNVLNMVPRVLWPGKPLMGIEYAKWRGFAGGDSDIGVFATVSSGLIGQGVLEFGPIFGPVAPAAMMALWCSLLARWWTQRKSLLRLILFMLALGITFNLGRDISVLIFWPVIFAYLMVRLIEKAVARPSRKVRARRAQRIVGPVRVAALPPVPLDTPAGGL